jgi:hypothetical protein
MDVKYLILNFSEDPKSSLYADYGISNYTQLSNLISSNRGLIKSTILEVYDSGIVCIDFQKKVNKVFKKANKPSINFYQECTINWMQRLPEYIKRARCIVKY